MPLAVAHIITQLELGGAQQNTLFTVAHLDRARYRPILITGEPGLLDREARDLPEVDVFHAPSLRRPIRPLADCRALAQLTRLLRRLRPAIVHTHSSKAGILGRWAAGLARVPIVVHTIHGFGITPDQSPLLRRLLIAAERSAARCTTRFFAVSEANRALGVKLGLFDLDRCAVVRSGIDLAAYGATRVDVPAKKQELGLDPHRPVVGMIAPMKPQKAPLDFLRVAAQVRSRRPDAQFVYVGDGELREAMEAEMRASNLAGHVRLVGWRRDVPDVMRCLDICLLTSRWEGLPRVCLEAVASGVPVVATCVDGVPEVIADGINGYLRGPGEVAALAERVTYLLDRPDEAQRMRRGAGSLSKEFDIHEMVRQQEREYDRLISAVPNGLFPEASTARGYR